VGIQHITVNRSIWTARDAEITADTFDHCKDVLVFSGCAVNTAFSNMTVPFSVDGHGHPLYFCANRSILPGISELQQDDHVQLMSCTSGSFPSRHFDTC
jgi:hypothetical protein